MTEIPAILSYAELLRGSATAADCHRHYDFITHHFYIFATVKQGFVMGNW